MCAASDAFTASQVAEFVDRAVQITVKIIVVIGSAIVALGKKNIISAAITTPIL